MRVCTGAVLPARKMRDKLSFRGASRRRIPDVERDGSGERAVLQTGGIVWSSETCRSTDGILACPGGGKVATAARGGKRERLCGGERERKEAR